MEYRLNGSDIIVSLQEVHIDANVGESARMDVNTAVNYIQSGKAEIDAAVDARLGEIETAGQGYVNQAQTYAGQAANSATSAGNSATTATTKAGEAKQWAIGDPSEPSGNSAKYWAEQAQLAVGTFTFEQTQASDTWTITHNLNKYPSVTIVDSAGNEFYPAIQYINENQVVVTMNGATTGKAFLN